MAPAEQTVRYAWAETAEGRILVAFSETGIVWASFASAGPAGEARALDDLAHRVPDAALEIAGAEHASWVAAVARHVDSPRRPGRRPPLDLHGTVFQREVWDQLLAIPAGSTMSYGEVAAAIGRPKAYRAVAQACRANPVAMVVPCHRVIGSDGSMTGYGGPSGVDRKRRLLENESRQ